MKPQNDVILTRSILIIKNESPCILKIIIFVKIDPIYLTENSNMRGAVIYVGNI